MLTTPFTAEALGGGWMEESVTLGRPVPWREEDLARETAEADIRSPGFDAPVLTLLLTGLLRLEDLSGWASELEE